MDDESYEEVRLGPMTPEETARLLTLAEELRARNIDPEFWLRALFIDELPEKANGRRPKAQWAKERDERRLASYAQTLRMLQSIDAGLRVRGEAAAPYRRAVAAYRRAGKGGGGLEAQAAMLTFGTADVDEALRKLATLRQAVRRVTE